MKKIPVGVITGFLGSGKTTLINTLIDSNPDKKIAVIVNEFGEIGVDSDLLTASKEYKIEISNGCACCVVRSDLDAAVIEMTEKFPDLDYLLIEASGLAEPLPIVQTFVHNLTLDKPVYLDSVMCLIDSFNFVENLKDVKTLHEQIEYSDFLVLSKISQDLAKTAQTRELIKELRPEAVVVDFDPKKPASIQILLDTHSFTLTQEMENEMKHEHKHEHNEFEEIAFKTTKFFDPNKLDDVFTSPEFRKLVRAKGFLKLSGQPKTTFIFQLVGHGRQLSESPLNMDESRLIMIGRGLDKEKILSALKDCLESALKV